MRSASGTEEFELPSNSQEFEQAAGREPRKIPAKKENQMNAPQRHEDFLQKPAPQQAPLPRTAYVSSHGDLLQEAVIEQAAAKVGIFGLQGSGKSTLAALVAIGLSLTYHNAAPVAYHDTENGSDFLKPLFDMEGVKLLVRKSKCFADAGETLKEAARKGCCAFIEDSITGDWDELMESFKKKKGITKIELYHWGQLKPQWNEEWVTPMLNSPLHVITCGRAGDVWEDRTMEDGSDKAMKVGTKMRAEGQFGYEPSLLIEMRAVQGATDNRGKRRRNVGRMLHIAEVLKDRARFLNGKVFEWPDINTYKKGDWKKFFGVFDPHFQFLNIGGKHVATVAANSTELFDANGDAEYYKRKQRVTIALEEIEGTIAKNWPGSGAKDKAIKADVIETLFSTRSWTKVTSLPLDKLEHAVQVLYAFEHRFNGPKEEAEVVKQALTDLSSLSAEELGPQKFTAPLAEPGKTEVPKAEIPTLV